MTALARAGDRAVAAHLALPLLLGTGLAGLVAARWAATIEGSAGGLAVGLAFGLGLLALALAGGTRSQRPRSSRSSIVGQILGGVLGGVLLIGLALLGMAMTGRLSWAGPLIGPSIGPAAWVAAGFAPWASVTVLVATSEELVLRGALFQATERALGAGVAVVAMSLAFALIHVPLYGWHVVPLDLGVGLLLGGLRLVTGGVTAPAAAHAIADLATWWL
jgi:membrane protease YdiL (CAAX protease family)